MDDLTTFYSNKEEPNKSCLITLRNIILEQDKHVTATQKYGMPCFCYKGKMFCYLWIDKKSNEPYILFVEGNKLNHQKLETGNRKRMKILRVNPNKDIEVTTIISLIKSALNLYRNGIIKVY